MSSLNPNAKDNRGCVAAGVDKTGPTAAAVFAFIDLKRPLFVRLENVKGLRARGPDGKSNLDHLIEMLNGKGYLVYSSLICSSEFAVPQRRDRLWIICFLVSDGPQNQFAKDFKRPKWMIDIPAFHRSLRLPKMPLEKFRLTDHPDVKEWWDDLTQSMFGKAAAEPDTKRRKKTDKKEVKWESVHYEEFKALSLDWPIEDLREVEQDLAEKVSFMCRRGQEIAVIVHRKYKDFQMEKVQDLNPTVAWDAHEEGQTPCIVCSATLRLLQGLPPDQIENLRSLDHQKMVELAGNALCAFHMMPVLLSLFSLFPWCMGFHSGRHNNLDEPEPAGDDHELDVDGRDFVCE